MNYVTADLHGCSPKALRDLLLRVGFSSRDHLYVLGDAADRGPHGARLLLWLSCQPNVTLILGNHEAMLLSCDFLFREATEETLDALTPESLTLVEAWLENGGGPTLRGLRQLLKRDPEAVEGILDYLRECPLWEEVEAAGHRFLLVHGGLGNFSPDKPMDAYTPEELTMARPALTDRYDLGSTRVLFGHTPTVQFGAEYAGRFLKTDTWMCLDVGTALGHGPALLRLEDLAEFYAP